MNTAEEPIDAELEPTRWTLSNTGGVLLAVASVDLLFEGLSGSWDDYLLAIVCLAAFPFVYASAHRPTPTEAWFEEDRLVVNDPNPWWKLLTSAFRGFELRLRVDSVEQEESGPVVTGSARWLWWRSKYTVWLKPKKEEAGALEARLAEMVQG